MEKVIIKQANKRLTKLLLGGIIMTLGSIGVLHSAIEYMNAEPSFSTFISRNKEISFVFAVIGIVFFTSATVLVIYEIINKTPLLTICNRGIVYHSGLTRNVKIAWVDVEVVYKMNLNNHTFLSIKLKSIGDFLQKQNWITRRIINLSLSMGQSDITISVASTNESPAKVLVIINKYWDEWKNNNEYKTL